MLKGSKLQKIKSQVWKKPRQLRLQGDGLSVWCESKSRRKPSMSTFSVMEIQSVREGHQSEVMRKHGRGFSEQQCFTIVFQGNRTNLDLVAETPEERRRWVRGLHKLMARAAGMSQREKLHHWIHQYLHKADKDNDSEMSFQEIKDLVKMINLKVNEEYITCLFQQCDRSKSSKLEEHEIEEFCQLLMQRPELEEIFNYYSGEDQILAVREISNFLKEQKEVPSEENGLSIIQRHELNEKAKQNQLLTRDGFVMYMLSPDGDIFNHSHDLIYQDMGQPLSHYFISSSHNTYLMENQLGGPSSTEAYIRALLRGCRCVELDCWDGANGEPVVYHGHTLTSKILFKDVVTAIRDYAFKMSPFPLILSLENHCGVEQQMVMARHFTNILGNLLVTGPVDGKEPEELPSPEELKGKIVIRGKRLTGSGDVDSETPEEEEEEEEEESVTNEEKSRKRMTQEMSELVVYCRNTRFQGFEAVWSRQVACETSSFSETKAKKLINDCGTSFVRHNTLQLSKVYPLGSRISSSNFNPQDMWNAGCHLVSLNFQKCGAEMDLNEGRFRQNGRCGYVLKPDFMRSSDSAFSPTKPVPGAGLDRRQLVIDVITAQQLPKVNKTKKNSIVDPQVRVEVHGVPEDNASGKTGYVTNNGFNPVWNEVLRFGISVPELALIRFVVEDYDTASSNDFIGQFTLPFTSVQQGYRHVHLLAKDGTSLSPATLFVRIRIESESSGDGDCAQPPPHI
ncbi:1-phosphatidylinositol 4,5-bisphosphate phosphodiesterase delta-3-like isoform X2 [Callorhinchus milii]|nr:1-phosphatidylinositol 4,5-bisphosphate phosphodiesterase delta-3-like isoform X2 [Callorhinchus milii]